MLENLLKPHKSMTKIADLLQTKSVIGANVKAAEKSVLACFVARKLGKKLLLIVPHENMAQKFLADLQSLNFRAEIFYARDLILQEMNASGEYESARIGILTRLINNELDAIIATPESLFGYTTPREKLQNRLINLQVGREVNLTDFIAKLVNIGYTRLPEVSGAGVFSVRGDIIDIAPANFAPVRIELFGDEIESISILDLASQRREKRINSVQIAPCKEVLFDDIAHFQSVVDNYLANKNLSDELCENLEKFKDSPPNSFDRFMNLAYTNPATILDYLQGWQAVLVDETKLNESLQAANFVLDTEVQSLLEDGELLPNACDFKLQIENINNVNLGNVLTIEEFLPAKSANEIIEVNLKHLPPLNKLSDVVNELKDLTQQNYKILIFAGLQRNAEVLLGDLKFAQIPCVLKQDLADVENGIVTVFCGSLQSGIMSESAKIAMFTRAQRAQTAKKSFIKKDMTKAQIGSLDELAIGDYVVHIAHGIGLYGGIEKKQVRGLTQDYIKISYTKGDVLFVPVLQLDLIAKYIGPKSDGAVKINSLSSESWLKTKQRVKRRIEEMSRELIKLYSKRMRLKGFAHFEDDDIQKDFEGRFEHTETADQLRAIEEIKQDMTSTIPMDRLLCGDVGVGKTEVAFRAAMKTVLSNKQAALIAPTTLLANQHYNTLLERLADLPVRVEVLSRFRSGAQISKAIKDIKNGEVDIVIGTHRVMSKDIEFKDLGLLVVDEEQRFGVKQKEKLREKFPTVDTLTLSATPIPRTLNMSLVKIRDMSIIDTPPFDRQPIQTFVLEYNMPVLIHAINKELKRGGQVYWLHNNTETIAMAAFKLSQELPNAKIEIAHGKMDEARLKRVWHKLLNAEIDILVCTTIIETGIDVANVNTLVIENADRMGLAQLHQIRGRVGRSDKKAYAYLTYKPQKSLTEVAAKRLNAIREYTEFGAGFLIAMQDLEIRGAGNVLGAAQHGAMEAVGYDMYLKLLNQAVTKREIDIEPELDVVFDLDIAAHISEKYIESSPARIKLYRRIADVGSEQGKADVLAEIKDRFGKIPPEVENLVEIALLRHKAKPNFLTVMQKDDAILFYFKDFNLEFASKIISSISQKSMLNAGEKPYLAVKIGMGENVLKVIEEVLGVEKSAEEIVVDKSMQV